MADISTRFCGRELESLFVLGSGTLPYGADSILRAYRAGPRRS